MVFFSTLNEDEATDCVMLATSFLWSSSDPNAVILGEGRNIQREKGSLFRESPSILMH